MEFFFQSTAVKIITLLLVIIMFILIPTLNQLINSRLSEPSKKTHAKMAKDAWVKTILLFSASLLAGLLAFFNGNLDKAISQAFFGLCFFTSLNSTWTIKKTKASILEARKLSISGKRESKINDIEEKNNHIAQKSTRISFLIGLPGLILVVLFFDKYSFPWVWFVAFLSTGFAIQSARWSEFANIAIAKYASDPMHGV